MKIVNPLYDKAFKYLMENNRLAKKVLGVILETEIEELTLGQQETVVPDEKRGFTLFRLDFKAVIKNSDGTSQKVLIELQKSKYETDIQRFRNYLGVNYMSKFPANDEATKLPEDYPIITIYILGYEINDLPYLAVSVNNQIINSVNHELLNIKSQFVEMLTHRSHILQVKRLPRNRQTRIEQFMILFNQAWHSEKKYILDLQEIPEEFRDIAEYLEKPVFSEDFRRQLEAEEEIDTIFDRQEAKYLAQIEEARQEAEEAKLKLAQKMLKYGEPIEEIMKETGLSREDVERLS
jgi:predicted transposase/invertase (TIGR01784 family)